MTTKNDMQRLAEGALKLAVKRLAHKYPFHVAVLERFTMVPRPAVGTMAVAISGDDVLLLFNPEFVLGTLADELAGVLLHEVHHVVLRHVLADPADYPDQWARTVAEEVTANEFIVEPLPDNAIRLEQFPSLRSMQSTDERYRRLVKRVRRPPISGPGTQSGGNRQHGTGRGTLDDHSVWEEESVEDPTRSEAAIRSVVQDAVFEVGHDAVPEELADTLGEMGVGNKSGASQQELDGGRRGRVDWRRLLRRYIGQLFEVRPVFNRPPRRFPELVGIMPGKCRQHDKPKVMAVIDTSGSVTPDLLELIDAELGRLARHYTVTVVECDVVIHAVYPYRPLTAVHGRGGTDLRPPFEQDFLRKHRPDLLIYFTDGFGPAPARPPRVPVIWCLVPDGEVPVNWGKEIHMDGGESTG